VNARLADHNAGRCSHTAAYRPWRLHVVIEFAEKIYCHSLRALFEVRLGPWVCETAFRTTRRGPFDQPPVRPRPGPFHNGTLTTTPNAGAPLTSTRWPAMSAKKSPPKRTPPVQSAGTQPFELPHRISEFLTAYREFHRPDERIAPQAVRAPAVDAS